MFTLRFFFKILEHRRSGTLYNIHSVILSQTNNERLKITNVSEVTFIKHIDKLSVNICKLWIYHFQSRIYAQWHDKTLHNNVMH